MEDSNENKKNKSSVTKVSLNCISFAPPPSVLLTAFIVAQCNADRQPPGPCSLGEESESCMF